MQPPRPEGPASDPAACAASLAGFYFLYYGAIGITLPFLPAYLEAGGLTATQIGLLLAISPALSLLAPPRWGSLADRTGRPDLLLRFLTAGAVLCFAPLLWLRSFLPLTAALAGHALFASALVPLADALTLERVHLRGGSYARIRLFGSLGFVVTSGAFGLWGARFEGAVVAMPLVLMTGYALWSWTLHAPAHRVLEAQERPRARVLLRDATLLQVFLACALHWIACAPFNGDFALHVRALGLPPAVVGGSAALGVLAEVLVMALHPWWSRLLSPTAALGLAFILSALRWVLTGVLIQPALLVLVSLFHGFTFGAFYVSAVTLVAQRVPEKWRASGQALFIAVTFGLGGLLGYTTAGRGYDRLGGPRLFAVAAVLELVAAAWVLLAGRRPDAPLRTGVIA